MPRRCQAADLSKNGIGLKGVTALCEALAHNQALGSLALDTNSVGDEGAEVLARFMASARPGRALRRVCRGLRRAARRRGRAGARGARAGRAETGAFGPDCVRVVLSHGRPLRCDKHGTESG